MIEHERLQTERWRRYAWFMARGWWGLAAREVEIMHREEAAGSWYASTVVQN